MPLTRRNRQVALIFLLGVLLGIVFVGAAKGSAAMPDAVAVPVAMESGMCGEESDDCYLMIYTPGICDMVVKYGYWYYAFYCDQREGGRLMAGDIFAVEYLPDGSTRVELFRVVDDRRVYMVRHMPPRAK
jgi:hypothetical protein